MSSKTETNYCHSAVVSKTMGMKPVEESCNYLSGWGDAVTSGDIIYSLSSNRPIDKNKIAVELVEQYARNSVVRSISSISVPSVNPEAIELVQVAVCSDPPKERVWDFHGWREFAAKSGRLAMGRKQELINVYWHKFTH